MRKCNPSCYLILQTNNKILGGLQKHEQVNILPCVSMALTDCFAGDISFVAFEHTRGWMDRWSDITTNGSLHLLKRTYSTINAKTYQKLKLYGVFFSLIILLYFKVPYPKALFLLMVGFRWCKITFHSPFSSQHRTRGRSELLRSSSSLVGTDRLDSLVYMQIPSYAPSFSPSHSPLVP